MMGGFGFGAGMFGIGVLIMIGFWVLVTLAPAVTQVQVSAARCGSS